MDLDECFEGAMVDAMNRYVREVLVPRGLVAAGWGDHVESDAILHEKYAIARDSAVRWAAMVIPGKTKGSRPGVSMFVAVEFAQEEAARAAQGLAADGYKADFTIAGLAEVDRFFHDHAPGGVPTPGGRLAEFVGERLFAIAGYIGETLRRELGGAWRHRPGAEADPTAVEVMLPDGRVLEPYEWVFFRLQAQPPGGVHRLGWLLLDHRVLAPADGRSWVAPSEAVERLRAAVPEVREDDAAAIHAGHPLTTMMRTSGVVPPEVLADIDRQLTRVRYVTVADADTGRSVELTLMPDEAIAVHHPPALTPVVEACGRALGYVVTRMDLPPITLPTASPPPSRSGWWGKVRLFLGLGSRPTASREENE